MKGEIADSVSPGSSQRGATVMWAPIVELPVGGPGRRWTGEHRAEHEGKHPCRQ